MLAGERNCDVSPLTIIVSSAAPYTRVRVTVENQGVGVQSGQYQRIMILSVTGWGDLVEAVRDDRCHVLKESAATRA